MNQTDKKKLLRYIQEVSFAIDDVVLYLDTHPYDEEALKYYKSIRNYTTRHPRNTRNTTDHYKLVMLSQMTAGPG